MDKKKAKFGELFRENLQKIIIIALSGLYIAQGLFTVSKKDATILEILGSIALSLIVGIIISQNFLTMGLKDGRRSDLFTSSLDYYSKAKSKINKWLDSLSIWCEYKNKQELMLKKKDIITSAGLSWKGFKYGYYEEHPEKLTDDQKKAIEKAKTAQIAKITYRELLSDLPASKFMKGKRFGQGEKDYTAKESFSDFAGRFAGAIIGGLYTLSPLINGDNWQEVIANVLWNATQIAMWICFGCLKYANAKTFIEDEYRQTHLIQKAEYLNEFAVCMENNPEVLKEFDDNTEIDRFINDYIKEKERALNEQGQVNISS